jgi:phosphoserine phosphatase RsbU/P
MIRLLRSSITIKMALLVLGGTSLVFAAVLLISSESSKQLILADAEKDFRTLTHSLARKVEQEFRAVEKVPGTLARVFEVSPPKDKAELEDILLRVVKENGEIFGATVAFEPFAFLPEIIAYSPYVYKSGSSLAFQQLADASYDYFKKDWYRIPRLLKKAVWSDPYFDEGGGFALMTTYSCPLFKRAADGEQHLAGIVTADISLDRLTSVVDRVEVATTGYCFIISDTGKFVTHPNRKLIMRESIFSLAEERKHEILRAVGRAMISEESGWADIGTALGGNDAFLAFHRIESPGWSVAAVVPKEELFEGVTQLHQRMVLVVAVGLVLLAVVSFAIGGSVSRPLRRLAEATDRVAHGDLDVNLSEIHRSDELGRLAVAFTKMTVDLKQYIHDLTQTTAAKERMESELSLAANIQRSMLPSVFPAFPDRSEFDIYAVMHPAKEVGGDFYQFFLLDDNQLCFAVGDVSGKGIPAALFMTVTTYLIKAIADEGFPPDEILARLNRQLARGNDACMFVTIFCGILDLRSGELSYANGGHNSPVLLRREDDVNFLGPPGGPVVGIFEEVEFSPDRLVLQPGDTLLVYTDGVTEAFNKEEQLFSDESLMDHATGLRGGNVTEVVEGVLEAVRTFSTGAEQADDITILAVQYRADGG